MTDALDRLLAAFDLERVDDNIYRSPTPSDRRLRYFGGQVAAQALVAAGRTVPDIDRRPVHSLHAYFLRPGDPTIPILYEVDRLRDGQSFTTRRVAAIQRGEAIFHLSASFHLTEIGVTHQESIPDVPDPETLPTWSERMAPYAQQLNPDYFRGRPIDVRHVDDPVSAVPGTPIRPPHHRAWLRSDGRLPDDPLVHACVLAYASDLTLLDTIMLPHGLISGDQGLQASLDHAMWFHRPCRADDWLLQDQHSPVAGGARGLAMGTIFTRNGELAVTVVQEGLVRSPKPSSV